MPHIIISVQIRTEIGPTLCGDEKQNPQLMKAIGAELKQEYGSNFKQYVCQDAPRIVLDRLENLGYQIVGLTGCGQTVLWTMHKPKDAWIEIEIVLNKYCKLIMFKCGLKKRNFANICFCHLFVRNHHNILRQLSVSFNKQSSLDWNYSNDFIYRNVNITRSIFQCSHRNHFLTYLTNDIDCSDYVYSNYLSPKQKNSDFRRYHYKFNRSYSVDNKDNASTPQEIGVKGNKPVIDLNHNTAKQTNSDNGTIKINRNKDIEKPPQSEEITSKPLRHSESDTSEFIANPKCDTSNSTAIKKPADRKRPVKKNLFQKFRYVIDIFWTGCKALFKDVRIALSTRRKLGLYHAPDYDKLTREELRHMRQTKQDVVKTFPVALLFMVPFIGYSAPIMAYFYPRQLLSQQFWHPDQKKEFVLEEYEKRSQYYLPLIKEVGVTAKEIKNKQLLKFCIKTLDGNHPGKDELLMYNELFGTQDDFNLKKMPRYHLVKLCKCWLIPTSWYLPRWFLVNALRKRIAWLHQDDRFIKRDGVHLLTPECIEQAVHVRGLDESSLCDASKLHWLTEWIDLSSQVSDADVSFLAHAAVFKAANFERIRNGQP